jgi:hypothetical protein
MEGKRKGRELAKRLEKEEEILKKNVTEAALLATRVFHQ